MKTPCLSLAAVLPPRSHLLVSNRHIQVVPSGGNSLRDSPWSSFPLGSLGVESSTSELSCPRFRFLEPVVSISSLISVGGFATAGGAAPLPRVEAVCAIALLLLLLPGFPSCSGTVRPRLPRFLPRMYEDEGVMILMSLEVSFWVGNFKGIDVRNFWVSCVDLRKRTKIV
jgi:hypothetical protein